MLSRTSISFIFVLTKTTATPQLSSMVYESQLVGKVSLYICERLSLLPRQGSKTSELFSFKCWTLKVVSIHLPHKTEYPLAVIHNTPATSNNSELLTTTPTYLASTSFPSFNSTSFSSPWATMLFFFLYLCPYENNRFHQWCHLQWKSTSGQKSCTFVIATKAREEDIGTLSSPSNVDPSKWCLTTQNIPWLSY